MMCHSPLSPLQGHTNESSISSCGIQNSRNMEKIQERTYSFVYEDYESTYDILLKRETMIYYTYVT